jgi:hypothetical protein
MSGREEVSEVDVHATSETDWWDELAVAALLGTDRRPLAEFAFLPGELGVTAARLDGDPAAVLLDASALAVGYRRGGVMPTSTTSAEADRAPTDQQPRAGRRAGAQLTDLLAGNDLELLMYWCATATQAARLAPPECLPGLLDLAVKQPMLRPVVAPVLGARGRWLARQQPSWAKIVPAVEDEEAAGSVAAQSPASGEQASAGAGDAGGSGRSATAGQGFGSQASAGVGPAVGGGTSTGGPVGNDQLDPRVWDLGTAVQRANWLRATRRADPGAGVATLARTWAQESGPHRAGFLALLEPELGPTDEGLLETALDDRRQDVRTVAAGLLATLPSSAFADRMRSRAKSFVHPERSRLRTRLVVDVPDRLDPAALRDGLTDVRPNTRMTEETRRLWWLEQVVAATPLSAWEQLFETPQQALAVRFDEPWSPAIHAGWAWAAVRQRDREWALALLETRSRHRVEELLTLLDGDELAAAIRARIGRLAPADVQLLTRYLDVCPVPWPSPVAADVLAWLLTRMPELHPRTAQPLLNLISYRFPIEGGAAIVSAADDLPLDDLWRPALRSAARLIAIRTRIHEELQ